MLARFVVPIELGNCDVQLTGSWPTEALSFTMERGRVLGLG